MSAMDEIRHLVVLMLENQSFDRLLGYLDLGDRTQKLEGLSGAETNPVSPPTDMTPVPVTRVSAPSAYVTDPGHDFEDVNQQFGLPRFLTARDAAANTFDRNFLPSARSVPLTNLRGLVPVARTSAPAGRALSAYQRSLQALAEAMGNPPRSAPGVDEAARHAQTFLQQPQSP
jgi:hypothetical protein